MKLQTFLDDCLERTRHRVRQTTLVQYGISMKHFIAVVGNIKLDRVSYEHGERYLTACLDAGLAPATARKHIRHVKRLPQLAVERGQLEDHPWRRLKTPRLPKAPFRIYSNAECQRILEASVRVQLRQMQWNLLIMSALATRLRRGELLNLTWRDVDFDHRVVHVAPKADTDHTWEWHIKDTNRRTLPLTDELTRMLVEHQLAQPDGMPYVFIPPQRYEHIQGVRRGGKWSVPKGCCPVNNFTRNFKTILAQAGIEDGEFHDLRRTCITGWFAEGLSEFDVMKMAGHSSFETTHRFYLRVCEDVLERTRRASEQFLKSKTVARLLRAPP